MRSPTVSFELLLMFYDHCYYLLPLLPVFFIIRHWLDPIFVATVSICCFVDDGWCIFCCVVLFSVPQGVTVLFSERNKPTWVDSTLIYWIVFAVLNVYGVSHFRSYTLVIMFLFVMMVFVNCFHSHNIWFIIYLINNRLQIS